MCSALGLFRDLSCSLLALHFLLAGEKRKVENLNVDKILVQIFSALGLVVIKSTIDYDMAGMERFDRKPLGNRD